ncbi:biotin--[acetyl-CoA-carboxylase] ligase [Chloroflexota bacterium]
MRNIRRVAGRLWDNKQYISGEELGKELAISRTAVWKQIRAMQDEGFVIDARPGLGYRLISCPDKLLPFLVEKQLNTSVIGRNIYYYSSVDSTNSVASDLAGKGSADGSVVITEEQAGGKGRFGRHWVSPRQTNILISIILRPNLLPHQVPRLAMLGAVSVADSIRKLTGLEIRLKWPNEILLQEKKVGGILTEFNAEMDKVDFVILGIGINVNFDLSEFQGLSTLATSLSHEAGAKISRLELLQILLEEVDTNYKILFGEGLTRLVERWNTICWGSGEEVEVDSGEGKRGGILKRIDENGRLVIAGVDTEQVFAVGEGVSLSRAVVR